jgi:hypothetical protein
VLLGIYIDTYVFRFYPNYSYFCLWSIVDGSGYSIGHCEKQDLGAGVCVCVCVCVCETRLY